MSVLTLPGSISDTPIPWGRSSIRSESAKPSSPNFDAFTGVVESQLKKGNQVQITGFGKFYVQKRGARQGVNPQTKQKINIPASKVPKFTAGNALKDSIK